MDETQLTEKFITIRTNFKHTTRTKEELEWFQNYALFPHMTVYENLAFPLKVRKIAKDEIDKKVDKALSMVSLTGFENRMPGQLSGGQQQR